MTAAVASFDTSHEDMIHDAQMDYYGRRLATASSDRTVRLFEVDGQNHRLLQVLQGHEGPVWQVAWAHPKFGNILASCSYDGRVLVWREANGQWSLLKDHRAHDASVNSVAWAPHEHGLYLACASSDGKVSILGSKDNQWDVQVQLAHPVGCNAVTWAPAVPSGVKRFATGGCDNLVKIWKYSDEDNQWKEEETIQAHGDWVRDVVWAPNVGGVQVFASCSQDKVVYIHKKESEDSQWTKVSLKKDKFPDVVWRLSWSVTGTILAVSSGDNKVSLWKESLDGEWETISELDKI